MSPPSQISEEEYAAAAAARPASLGVCIPSTLPSAGGGFARIYFGKCASGGQSMVLKLQPDVAPHHIGTTEEVALRLLNESAHGSTRQREESCCRPPGLLPPLAPCR